MKRAPPPPLASRPPGSSRRAGGYSPVFRLGSLTRLPERAMSQKANSFGHGNEQACAGYLKENTRRNSSCSPAARTLWGSSPPGSSRRAGGYSSVLRLTADEVSLPYSPVPKSSPSGTRLYLPRGTFWVRSAPVRSRTPQGRFPPARLLHPGGRCGQGLNFVSRFIMLDSFTGCAVCFANGRQPV